MALTHKQKLFIEHYAVTGNGAESSIKAGYSPKHARTYACELLSNPNISALVEKKRAEIQAKYDISKEEILKGVREIAERDDAKDSDKVQAFKLLAQITGNLKESTTNVAIFSNLDAEDNNIISKRLRPKNLQKVQGDGQGHH